MDVRRVEIENYRGIKHLLWCLPAGQSFVTLVGPGDSAKSSILSAIDMALSDRWNLSINDTDFYMGEVEEPISIRIALADLPPELKQHDVLGMALCGIDADGELHEDPEDEHEPCVVIALTITKDLEPSWTAHRLDKGAPEAPISAAVRRLIGSFKVDERVDAHLRWSRTSALGRLTEAKHGTTEVLATASRAARDAVAGSVPQELADLTTEIGKRLHEIGSGEFIDLKPGLDQSLSNSTGNLALHDGPIPLTGYGLGSRRLAGVATQQLAHAGKGVLLIDEVEYGLEPHRLVNLLAQLQRPGDYALALATTHSPTALRHIGIEGLGIVRRSTDGAVQVQNFIPDDLDLQKLLRSAPEAFLARRIVICEGKTEHGLCLRLVEEWDRQRSARGESVSAGLGAAVVDGQGGSKAVKWAAQLNAVGYEVVLFMDSDVEADRKAADALDGSGIAVVRWADMSHTERAVCDALNIEGLASLLAKAVELDNDPSSAPGNLLAQMKSHGLPEAVSNLAVAEWGDHGVDVLAARQVIADAAPKSKWFKDVDKGKELASILLAADLEGSDLGTRLAALRAAIYAAPAPDREGDGYPTPEAGGA